MITQKLIIFCAIAVKMGTGDYVLRTALGFSFVDARYAKESLCSLRLFGYFNPYFLFKRIIIYI
jgi:hypothetical protein